MLPVAAPYLCTWSPGMLSRDQTHIKKNYFCYIRCFFFSEAILADFFFFVSVSHFYLTSGYQLTSSLQPSPHKHNYFEMCNSTDIISPYVASYGPLALLVIIQNRAVSFSLHFMTFMCAFFSVMFPYNPFWTYDVINVWNLQCWIDCKKEKFYCLVSRKRFTECFLWFSLCFISYMCATYLNFLTYH